MKSRIIPWDELLIKMLQIFQFLLIFFGVSLLCSDFRNFNIFQDQMRALLLIDYQHLNIPKLDLSHLDHRLLKVKYRFSKNAARKIIKGAVHKLAWSSDFFIFGVEFFHDCFQANLISELNFLSKSWIMQSGPIIPSFAYLDVAIVTNQNFLCFVFTRCWFEYLVATRDNMIVYWRLIIHPIQFDDGLLLGWSWCSHPCLPVIWYCSMRRQIMIRECTIWN